MTPAKREQFFDRLAAAMPVTVVVTILDPVGIVLLGRRCGDGKNGGDNDQGLEKRICVRHGCVLLIVRIAGYDNPEGQNV